MYICIHVRVHCKGIPSNTVFFFFSRIKIFGFAGKMLQHDAAAENTIQLYILYRDFKLTEILNCNAEINFTMKKKNRELTSFYVNYSVLNVYIMLPLYKYMHLYN